MGIAPSATSPRDSERVELGRYTVAEGKRVLYRQWLDRGIRVTDAPADGRGRTFLVDDLGDEGFGALQALVADYLQQAALHNHIPAERAGLDLTW